MEFLGMNLILLLKLKPNSDKDECDEELVTNCDRFENLKHSSPLNEIKKYEINTLWTAGKRKTGTNY